MGKPVKFPNLIAEMVKHGETQIELGKLLGLSQPSISRKLKGEVGWTLDEVDKICEHYGKDYYQLFK